MAERRMFGKWHLADAGVPLLTLSGGDHICYIRDLGENQNHIAAGELPRASMTLFAEIVCALVVRANSGAPLYPELVENRSTSEEMV